MKTIAATELLLVAAVLAIAYFVWMQQASLVLLEGDVDTIRRQVTDLATPAAAKPRAARTPAKPKETK